MPNILANLIQKLTTTKFGSSLIILVLTHLGARTETQVDVKLVGLVREALAEEPGADKA